MTDTIAKEALKRHSVMMGDAEIEYWQGGSGRPLVFLHGGQGFDPKARFVSLLAERFRVIAPSHPGFGRSSLPFWMDSVDDMAHAHLDLMDHLGIEDALLVGASIGGWIAAEMATMNLSRIGGIVLVSPVGVKVGSRDKLDVPDIFALPEDRLAKLLYHDPSRARIDVASKTDEELAVIVRNKETLALVTWEPYMHNPKLSHRLHRVRKPVLVLRGASDGLVQEWYAKAYADLLPQGQLEQVPEAGHAPHIEQPDAFVRRIVEFAQH